MKKKSPSFEPSFPRCRESFELHVCPLLETFLQSRNLRNWRQDLISTKLFVMPVEVFFILYHHSFEIIGPTTRCQLASHSGMTHGVGKTAWTSRTRRPDCRIKWQRPKALCRLRTAFKDWQTHSVKTMFSPSFHGTQRDPHVWVGLANQCGFQHKWMV